MRHSHFIVAVLHATVGFAAPITLTSLDVAVTENFNSLLAASGSAVSLPAGSAWTFLETGSSANTTYATGTGTGTGGNTYSFGASSSTERAFGTVRTGTVIPTLGVSFINQTGTTITKLEIGYTGEQWRLGTSGREDRLDFAYSLDATSLATGTWFDVNELDFLSPTTALAGALNGNAAANQDALVHTLTSLSLGVGTTFWLRWSDFEASGADDGLAIDDFSLKAISLPPPVTTPAENVPDDLPVGALALTLAAMGQLASRRRKP